MPVSSPEAISRFKHDNRLRSRARSRTFYRLAQEFKERYYEILKEEYEKEGLPFEGPREQDAEKVV